jgi:hypothetical protein
VTGPVDSSRDAQRYGTDRPRRRAVIIGLSAILAAAFVTWVVWAAWLSSDPAIDANVAAFDVVDSHEVRVKVTAEIRDGAADGTCLLRATAEDHTVVGELNLTVDQLRKLKGSWIPIRTERQATTAEVVRCSSDR